MKDFANLAGGRLMDKHETIMTLMKMSQSQKLEVAGKLMKKESGLELAKALVTNIVHEWEAGICDKYEPNSGGSPHDRP